ncbi:ER degradation-enhancing alpha-mannosidase-like protein 3 [Episyrphus balteatus]|uniref:ER degradation-enhancing alpha-mannosidase-like protein 3 n=1 Tax=Episyrphus balteatus TaxID=286459 RepID=UPI0024860072|nr:ER degradation-enhancing alpha-mannosidase-like protein 3 [Episyrphus balteatus]
MIINKYLIIYLTTLTLPSIVLCLRKYSTARKVKLREEVRNMFQHAYEGYNRHASGYDELRPLTCDGINTWGSYSLTLIDALDTLAVMGNYTEFRRVAKLISERKDFDADINVSVFETNIRIVGGLLSAHLMSHKAGMELEPGWPCNGPLLRLAEDVAKRILPAFDTKTGMPYGTVNLRHGVPPGETPVTCTAGVGTFIIEFGALSRLTGDPIYEEVALNAIYSLWEHRSPIGLLGNHIDVQTGRWTAQDAGIGAGVDSFFEYLVKGSIMLNRPDLLEMFHEGRAKIDKYMKRDDWYVWVGMNKGQVTLPVFQSLEAYWPGVLSLIGDISPAMKTLHTYHTVWRQYGFLPEFYNIPAAEAGANRESYPLRPELAESAMYLHRATKDPFPLEVGEDMITSIQYSAKTSCGYATIRNVRDHRKDNRMESFFLSETTKYLYLLFDENNFLHNDGGHGTLHETPNGMCIIDAGGYIFNTEGHPIDPSALQCCHELPGKGMFGDFDFSSYEKDLRMHNERQRRKEELEKQKKYTCPESKIQFDTKRTDEKLSIDIEVVDTKESGVDLANEMLENFKKIQNEALNPQHQFEDFSIKDILEAMEEVSTIDEMPTALLDFMKTRIIDPAKIRHLFQINSSTLMEMDLSKPRSIWSLYVEQHKLRANIVVVETLNLQKFDKYQNETHAVLNEILELLNTTLMDLEKLVNSSRVLRIILTAQQWYRTKMTNASDMLEFTRLFAIDSKDETNFPALLEAKKKLASLPILDVPKEHSIDLELFEKLNKLARFKKRMIDTFQKLQSLIESNDKETKEVDEEQSTTSQPSALTEEEENKSTKDNIVPKNDDLISVDSERTSAEEETTDAPSSPEKYFKQKPADSTGEETTNNSILTDFVHSIIKSTLPQKPKFDEQMFLKRIRAQGIYMNREQKYELLSCKAPKFLERFAHRYQVV